jgi:predicted DNA-binding ribbon-helix-helix protein
MLASPVVLRAVGGALLSSTFTFALYYHCCFDRTVRRQAMKSRIIKRSIAYAGKNTSVTLEDAFWNALKEIASERKVTLSELVATIDADRKHGNLSSAIRLFVFGVYRDRASTPSQRADTLT